MSKGLDSWGVDITQGFPYKTNAITLMEGVNKDLKNLCLQNNGKYIYISSTNISEFTRKESKITKFKNI